MKSLIFANDTIWQIFAKIKLVNIMWFTGLDRLCIHTNKIYEDYLLELDCQYFVTCLLCLL